MVTMGKCFLFSVFACFTVLFFIHTQTARVNAFQLTTDPQYVVMRSMNSTGRRRKTNGKQTLSRLF